MKKMIIAGVATVLVLGAAGGAAVFLMGEEPDAAVAGDPGAPAGAQPAPTKPVEVFYHHVQPEFVVNVSGADRAKYLMVEMSIATDDEKALKVIEKNQPQLRNDLLMVLGEQDALSLASNEGKTALREQASDVVDALVAEHYAPEHVLDVYLTRFVIQ